MLGKSAPVIDVVPYFVPRSFLVALVQGVAAKRVGSQRVVGKLPHTRLACFETSASTLGQYYSMHVNLCVLLH
jgi:hypothetical protein